MSKTPGAVAGFFPGRLTTLVLLFLLLASGLGRAEDLEWEAQPDAATSASPLETPVTSGGFDYIENFDGSISIDLDQLVAAYADDEADADSRFRGRELLVRGKVVKTGKPETPWLTLAGEKEEARIRCQLVPEASANPL
ncbi:MAG: hypothetical protein LBU79_01210, partial [Planctomycetota bacterium]|nr:hypothetical protein [Planctomycetota bacterium]